MLLSENSEEKPLLTLPSFGQSGKIMRALEECPSISDKFTSTFREERALLHYWLCGNIIAMFVNVNLTNVSFKGCLIKCSVLVLMGKLRM